MTSRDARTHRLLKRLTIIRLALQRARRRPSLCAPPNGTLDRAIDQVDAAAAELRSGSAPARRRPAYPERFQRAP